jgi:hypothetical protein
MRLVALMIIGTVGLIISANATLADTADLPPLQELTAEWWQWALSIPSDENPLPELDTQTQKCMVGQRGGFWFLAGSFDGSPATRTCTVPTDVTLFFPIVNFVGINAPNVCGESNQNVSVKDLRAGTKALTDSVSRFSVKVDHSQVKSKVRRVQSQVFEVALPKDNLFDASCIMAGLGPVPLGIYSPAVDDGYYASVGPLSAGKHTIQFQAEASGAIIQDVTYDLTVVQVRLQ